MERVTPEPIEWAWHEYIDDSSLRNSATSAPSGSKHGQPFYEDGVDVSRCDGFGKADYADQTLWIIAF